MQIGVFHISHLIDFCKFSAMFHIDARLFVWFYISY